MQVVIIWNAHLRNKVIGDLDLSSEIVSQFDDVLSVISRMNGDIEGESWKTLTIMVRLPLTSPSSSHLTRAYAAGSSARRPPSPPPHARSQDDELGFSLGDFDLDEEPAPPPSQQVSSSRGPPL
jgi:hypothetical protein